MNTVDTPDDSTLEAAVPAQNMVLVPLSRLRARPSKRNVRRKARTSIAVLAASIRRVGLLQNLTVVPFGDDGDFEVAAGGRRLAALKQLAKKRRIPEDWPVPCLLVADALARTASLAENVQREAMGPVEELLAWKSLVAEGRSVEAIAADFGVTPLVVKRRLRLANVSPRLLADYEAGAATLEQLMALAITDDHAAQEAAFYDSPAWQRSPEALREHLTHDEIDASRDALARFVGLEAYEAAGGGVRRDLFSDERLGGYLTDAGLLDTLARRKLAAVAEQVQLEGWGWVEVAPRATAAELHVFQRVRRTRRDPNRTEAKRIAKLEAKQSALQDRLDDEDACLSEDGERALQAELDRLGDELEAIEQTLVVYPPGAVAMAGAVVSVDRMGGVVVHRGLLREEEAKALRAQERQEAGAAGGERNGHDGDEADESAKPGISEKLARRLSAHRTAALQAEVARHPQVALVAVVHRLALRVVLGRYGSGGSPVDIIATPQDGLALHAPDIGDSPAATGMCKVREAWVARLPKEPKVLFAELLALPQSELLSLLAVCVASTVSVLASREDEAPAAELAEAVCLDMHDCWTPTAEGYFSHVSKAKALEAVLAFAPDHVTRLSRLRKAEMASEAERLAAGTGWLPVMFRGAAELGAGSPTSSGIEAVPEADEAAAEPEDREELATVA
ncbi:chromosome partitioning protein ParB [Variovorax paradoxus]|uniref:Chromosome partitioning protein ParB n=1 Tax=Variovorax paradoxus TaxID=34073 RepID=A0A5Q0M9C0_VARPD|nr:ParB/RepB/Spo0J family partition protein [Variovorax paradoxus]QFZ85022.1 chromosome partitioning protein ParB [Variovorax paradoxus]